jgi:hypothetical protein
MAVNNIRIQKLHTYNKFCNGGRTYERETQTDRVAGRQRDRQSGIYDRRQTGRLNATDTQIDTLADSQTNSLSM